jgi:hypothetical protein
VLLRGDDRGVLAIGQASHAWISGQLARAWGNERFGEVEPWEEVCLAAEQHDIGMTEWDTEPTYNARTGLPHSFTEMPLKTHIELWTAAPQKLIAQSRYAALLVSMHGSRLYERRDLTRLDAPDAHLVAEYLDGQRRLQDRLRAALQDDRTASHNCAPEQIRRNSDLIWIWDLLSLAMCLDWAPHTAKSVPTATEPTNIELTAPAPATLAFDPWPFRAAPPLTVHCEGVRLDERYDSADELQAALTNGALEAANFELRKA